MLVVNGQSQPVALLAFYVVGKCQMSMAFTEAKPCV